MPPFEITAVSTTARTVNASELGLITATGAQLATISLNSTASLLNLGSVVTQTTHAVRVENTAVATIANHGVIMGGGTLGTIDVYTGISDTRMNLHNTGTISTVGVLDTSAIVTRSGGQRIVNEGTISATYDQAIEILDELLLGIGNTIINTGLISGGVGTGSAIYLQGAGADTINNSGRITGDVYMVGGGNDVLLNSGTITGTVDIGGGRFENSGTIIGNVNYYGSDRIVVSGTIDGFLYTGSGNVTVDLRGGFVRDGAGGSPSSINAQTFLVSDQLTDVSFGTSIWDHQVRAWCDYTLGDGIARLFLRGDAVTGEGNARFNLIGGTGLNNRLDGADGNDSVYGEGGDDLVEGDNGDDLLFGGRGNDTLDGGLGNDTLDGGNGADLLQGGSGNDSMLGGDGKDTLEGGEGADVLTGGASADLFVFRDGDFSLTSAIRDRISDFRSGIDTIDLSAIDANVNDAQDSAFVRVGAFTNVAGQLILRLDAGSLVVEGDLNGDGTADVSIRLSGVTAILATDIVL